MTLVKTVKTWNPVRKAIAALIALGVLIGRGWFAWWTISPLFTRKTVSESLNTAGPALLQGNFVNGDSFHQVSSTALVVEQNSQQILRLDDNFKSINGPDLYVWLVKDGGVDAGYVEVGRLKGNQGGQNYTIPNGTNLAEYSSVYIWCRAFGVLFGSAKLAQG